MTEDNWHPDNHGFSMPPSRLIAIKEWRERDRDASKQIAKEKESYEVIRC